MATKPWRLTRGAEASLTAIAEWTIETFGARQARAYQDDLLEQCEAIAGGTAHVRRCCDIIDPDLPQDMLMARTGRHLIVFLESEDDIIIIIDFPHAQSDLPSRVCDLVWPDADPG